MNFAENASFKISFPLPDKLSMDRRDSDGFFSTRLVSRSSNSYNTTD